MIRLKTKNQNLKIKVKKPKTQSLVDKENELGVERKINREINTIKFISN